MWGGTRTAPTEADKYRLSYSCTYAGVDGAQPPSPAQEDQPVPDQRGKQARWRPDRDGPLPPACSAPVLLICIRFSALRTLGPGHKGLICLGSAEWLQVQRRPTLGLLPRPLNTQQ